MRPPVNIIKKICLLGDPSVGKTSLIQRYVFDTFSEDYLPTIGTKVVKKTMVIDFEPRRDQQVNLTLLIFDLLGQVEFAKVHRTYYLGSEGAIFVADLTREETILSISEWQDRFHTVVDEVPVILIGNKKDISQSKQRNKELLGEIASEKNLTYLYTSAKTGENVEKAFRMLAIEILNWAPI
jgi:small GTP-binding protein